MSIVDFSASIAVAESARQVFQEILDNLLAFNESSPTIFAEAETYLAAASTGLSQAAQSWDASTQTYLPPRRDADLSWKGTINTGWTKRQEMIEEVKRQNAKKTEFDRIAEMDYDDLLHNYSEIISAKDSGDLNSPYYKPNKTEYRIKLEKAVVKRYEEVKDLPRKNNVSKYTLQKVDPFFKAKIDRMNQKELEEYYPGLKFSPIAPILDHNYYSSEIDKANDIYLAARYQELDSQNPISKHDPNFEQKRFEYISRTGLDPVTGKEVDEELLNYATNYTKYAPSIKAGYDFLMVGTAAWSTRAYNKDIQTQRADAQINEYYKIKDAVRNSSVGSQPVVEIKTYSMDDLANLKHTENFTEKSKIHIFEGDLNRRGQSGGYHYDMVEGTSGNIIEGTRGPALNDAGIYEAKVEVNGIPKKANGGYSTFFPDHMSPQEVVDAINEAYETRVFDANSRNTYEGISKNGIKITMYLDSEQKIISAFPSSK
ncbi:Ribonuclease [Streptococcus sanguinis]|nr:Ribonuclease [Streptococcus sanguinis]